MKQMWPLTPLGEVLTERHETPSGEDLATGQVRIIEKISFDAGRISLRMGGSTKTGMILVRPGDLVVSGINAAKGAIAIHDPEAKESIAATIHYGAYVPRHDRVFIKYLWWLLRSRYFQEMLREYVPGGIKTELKAKRLLPVPVPLPPLEDQRRVVARIEELATRIKEARILRRQATEEAEALVNAELRSTSDWITARHGETLVGELLEDAGYGSSEKCLSERVEGAIPVLRIPNVASERVVLNDLKYACLSQQKRDRLMLSEGDILIVRTNGSLDLVGRSAVVKKLPETMAFASYMIRLRFDSKRIQPDYIQWMLRHLRVDGSLVNFARTTAGQYNVSLGRLKTAKIPVPPLDEQRHIVVKLDSLQAEVHALKRLQADTATEIDALLPSILDHAFKGGL